MVKCIEVETLSRMYSRAGAADKKLRIALVGLHPPTLLVLGKGYYVCRDIELLKKLIDSVLDGNCFNVVYIVRKIDEGWLRNYLPDVRYGDDVSGDGVATVLRVEAGRFRKTCLEKEILVRALEAYAN